MFLEETKICNYADDTIIYVCGPKIEAVLMHLERGALRITEWPPNNFMKLTEDKWHLIIFGEKRDADITIKIGEAPMKESKEQYLLGITLGQSLSSKTHVKDLCRKASQKLHALARISCYMDTQRLKQLMRVVVLSQFSYCPLILMFYDRTLNHKINHVHKRPLGTTYKDGKNEFGSLLGQTNIRYLSM